MLPHLIRRFPTAVFVILVAVDAPFVLTDSTWRGEWTATVEWANGGMFVAGPLLATACAYAAQVRLSPSARRLFGLGRTDRHWRAIAGEYVTFVVCGIMAHAIVVIGALAYSAHFWPSDDLRWESVGYAVLPPFAYVAVGLTAAAIVPHRVLAAALALVTSVGTGYLGVFRVIPGFLVVGGHIGSMVGLGYSQPALLGAFAGVVLVCVGAAIVLARRRIETAQAARAATVVLATLLVAGVVTQATAPTVAERIVSDTDALDYRCDGHAPRVCLVVGHLHSLHEVAAGVRAAFTPLIAAGVKPPPSVFESVPDQVGIADGSNLLLDVDRVDLGLIGADGYASSVTEPTLCPQYRRPVLPADLVAVSTMLAAWIRYKQGAVPTQDAAWNAAIRALSDRMLVTAYGDLTRCAVSREVLDAARSFGATDY